MSRVWLCRKENYRVEVRRWKKMDPQASERHKRAMSAVVRRPSVSARPGTASSLSAKPRARPYSAYSERGEEHDTAPKYDHPTTNREWWRFYLKVS